MEQNRSIGKQASCRKDKMLKDKERFSTGVSKEWESHRRNDLIKRADFGSELTPYTAI